MRSKLLLIGIFVLCSSFAYADFSDNWDFSVGPTAFLGLWTCDSSDSGWLTNAIFNVEYVTNLTHTGNASCGWTGGGVLSITWSNLSFVQANQDTSIGFWFYHVGNSWKDGETHRYQWGSVSLNNNGASSPTWTESVDNVDIPFDEWVFVFSHHGSDRINRTYMVRDNSGVANLTQITQTNQFSGTPLWITDASDGWHHLDDFVMWTGNFSDIPTVATPTPFILANITYPLEDEHINANFEINVSINQTGLCSINDSKYTLAFSNATAFQFTNNTIIAEGTHVVLANCTSTGGLFGNSTRTFVVDVSAPTFTVNSNNFFSTDNSTILTLAQARAAQLNITFQDNIEIFAVEINITDGLGANILTLQNISIEKIDFNFTPIINVSQGSDGVRNITINVWDTHTLQNIEPMLVKKGMNYLEFDGVRVTADNAISSKTTKFSDRYNFEFEYIPIVTPTKKVYYVESIDLFYLPSSEFKAHFIDFSNKVWIDFEGVNGKPTVTKVDDGKYKIEIDIESNKVVFNSIGKLNGANQSYSFSIEGTAPVINVTQPSSLTGNIPASKNVTIIVNVTDANRNSTTFFLYDSTHQIENQTFIITGNGSQLYNVTFTNLTQNLFFVNVSHTDLFDNSAFTDRIILVSNFLDNCSTLGNSSMPTLNVELRNDTNNNPVTATMEFLFEYNITSIVGGDILLNYSTSETTSNVTFCISPNSSEVSSDVWIDYSVNGISYNYFINDAVFNNQSQNLTLLTQEGTSSIRFRVTDAVGDEPIAGAFINVLKFDVGEGLYKTTEILKTDTEGFALGNIVLQTTWYKFIITFDGIARLSTEPEKFPTGSTERTFRVSLDESWYDNFDTARNIQFTLTFNNATNNFRFEYADPTGAAHFGCLKIDKLNISGRHTLSDNCTLSAAATILGNIAPLGTDLNNTNFIATAYMRFDDIIVLDILEKIFGGVDRIFNLKDGKGRDIGVFSTFMITGTLFAAGLVHPAVAIILSILALIGSSIIGLYQLTISSLVVIIVMGLILIWKSSR